MTDYSLGPDECGSVDGHSGRCMGCLANTSEDSNISGIQLILPLPVILPPLIFGVWEIPKIFCKGFVKENFHTYITPPDI